MSLFEPAVRTPPHTATVKDRPQVWVLHESFWREAVLWQWAWDDDRHIWWAYVDFYVGTRHHLQWVAEFQTRAREYLVTDSAPPKTSSI